MPGEVLIGGVALLAAYLLGAIPFALVIGKLFYRVDLREKGSGNLGATNAFRVLGPVAGVSVGVLDIAKGAVAAAFAMWLVGTFAVGIPASSFMLVVVFAVMAGHSFSPYIGFKGGKGISAAGGALFVIMPAVALILLAAFAILIAATRTVSIASVTIALMFPPLVYTFYSTDPVTIALAILAAAFAVWRHRSNISRIISGTEPKIGSGVAEREAAE